MQLVYRADNIAEAEIVKGMLEAYGLHAHVGGYYLQGGVGEMAMMDFANVHVPDSESARARDLIQDYEGGRSHPASEPPGAGSNAPSKRLSLFVIILAALAAGMLVLIIS